MHMHTYTSIYTYIQSIYMYTYIWWLIQIFLFSHLSDNFIHRIAYLNYLLSLSQQWLKDQIKP